MATGGGAGAARRVIVLVNAGAGALSSSRDGAAVMRIRRALESAGVVCDVRPVPGAQLGEAARAAARTMGVDAVVAAGGDGTQSAVAAALVSTETPLGVLPLGTRNHFAKDLGVPPDLDGAARVVARGVPRRVDVGEVNGRPFLNNASIGFYPYLVLSREARRAEVGRLLALAATLLGPLRRPVEVGARIRVDGDTIERTTPFVLVGNNRYDRIPWAGAGRSSLDRGELSLYLSTRRGWRGLLRLATRAALGKLERPDRFEMYCVRELWIETSRRSIHVAADGEVLRLRAPLHFRLRPGALCVLGPPPKAGAESGAA